MTPEDKLAFKCLVSLLVGGALGIFASLFGLRHLHQDPPICNCPEAPACPPCPPCPACPPPR